MRFAGVIQVSKSRLRERRGYGTERGFKGEIKMGCDIHLFVEKKVGDKWESCDSWEKSEFGGVWVPFTKRFYADRNYDLFGILANVRNGYGFAGCDTGEGFEPISQPRGIPDDASKEVSRKIYGGGLHSHSWLTLREIMDYDWTKITMKRGWVNGPEYFRFSDSLQEEFDEFPEPKKYSGGISGPGIIHVEPEEMEKLIKDLIKDLEGKPGTYEEKLDRIESSLSRTYTKISWQVRYFQRCQEFLGSTVPRLWRLGSPENVRIVFAFDN